MMKRVVQAMLPLGLALSACSQAPERGASEAATGIDLAQAPRAGAAKDAPAGAAIAVSLPRIAYVYEYGYRIDAEHMPALQRKHADLCEKQGPTVCRILEMRQSGSEGDYASGSLSLAVAAPRARAFGAELAKAAGEAGGQEVASGITGEDLSKQIVDTEARLRARSLLRDRLMDVLATRKGTVAELVEAERGVAQVNEEIDQARGWLAEMQGRVDFSRVNLNYGSGSPSSGGFVAPIREALGSIGGILGWTIAAIIMALTISVPLGVVFLALRAIWRRLRSRRPRPRPVEDAPPVA